MGWAEDQAWEAGWWSTCTNTFGEETKQITYAQRMGLVNVPTDGHWPVYDLAGRSVLDVGGGPASMLLKTINGGKRVVLDPCAYPDWVEERYKAAGIGLMRTPAEDYPLDSEPYDEVWLYNVLQHTLSPDAVLRATRSAGRLVRIFEWIDIPPHQGHPHMITRDLIHRWLGPGGTVEDMNENGCNGTAFYGLFRGGPPASMDSPG